MKKVFTKIAGLSVGLALAIGVGVAVGGREAKVAKAAFYTEMECDFKLKTTSHNKYDDNSGDGGLWAYNSNFSVYSGANNGGQWAYVKMGGKQVTIANYNPVYIKTTTPTTNAISKVEVNIIANTNSNKTKMGATWKLIVASDAAFANVIEEVDKGTLDITTAALYTFTPSSGTPWASGSYYKVEWTVSNTSTTNGIVWLDDIKIVYNQEVKDPDEIVVSGEDELTIGSSTTLTSVAKSEGSEEGVNQNVVWSSSDESVAKVSNAGVVTGVSNGTATIKATAENVSTVFGNLEVTVSGGKTNDLALVYTPDDMPAGYGDNYVVVGGVYTHVKQTMLNAGVIQIQKTNGLIENVGALPYDISEIEISFNAEKTQGTGFAIKASTDGETFVSLENEQIRTNRFAYSAPSTGYVYFQITAPTSGTLYLDEILINLGNADEAKMVTLATSLNTLLDAECAGDSDSSAITAAKWAEVEAAYADGDETAKADLKAVEGLSYIEVNQFLSRYDYIVGTYGYNNFLERTVSSSSAIRVDSGLYADNNTIIIVISIAAISALAFTALLVFKKKKQK